MRMRFRFVFESVQILNCLPCSMLMDTFVCFVSGMAVVLLASASMYPDLRVPKVLRVMADYWHHYVL